MIEINKRWRTRRQHWVTPEERFTPRGFSVDGVETAVAKAFIERHHYSHSFPAERISIGLYGPGAELVGLGVLSTPMSEHVLPKWTGYGNDLAAELGRFVCLPSVKFNGETWFLKRLFQLAVQEKGLRAILSAADPLEKRDDGGLIVKPAHYGTIYQAHNAIYGGRMQAKTELYAPDGTVVSRRTLTKIDKQDRGWQYAVEQLERFGVPPRRHGESWKEWRERVTALPMFRRQRHPGNFAYVFGLDTSETERLRSMHDGGQPYPKKERIAA